MRRRDKKIILVHTPVHASWLNQVEIYFSIIQRKVLTPNDFANVDAIRLRLALYEQLSNRTPKPFAWKFTRQDFLALESWCAKIGGIHKIGWMLFRSTHSGVAAS